MNIHVALKRKEQGSIFLYVVLTIIIVIIGGCSIYHIRKWAKRLDGGPPPASQTNDNSSITVPVGTNAQLSMYNNRHYFLELDDNGRPITNSFGPSEDPFPMDLEDDSTGALSVNTNAVTPVVMISLTPSNGIILAMTNNIGWTNMPITNSLDQYGFPLNSAWTPGQPSGDVMVSLERSTNLVDWVTIAPTIGVSAGHPSLYPDTTATNAGHYFYRTR